MSEPRFVPLESYRRYTEDDMRRRAVAFREELERRRTTRHFSDEPVPRDVIEECLKAAGTAPSGANLQPWHFVVVSDPAVKKRIRVGAEAEEREFYANRAPKEWLEALAPLGTDENKPHLETAPYLIVIFAKNWDEAPGGGRIKMYYAVESVGIATGMLIAALHQAGVASLTHTPSPMGFLNDILGRPSNERPYLILVTGYPADGARVPDIARKPFDEIVSFI